MIKNFAFDLGGVVLALSYEQAVRQFEAIGLRDARQYLDAFEQKGIFGALESGQITAEDFRRELSLLVGRSLTMDECFTAWHGYVDHVPRRNLEAILDLRGKGYKVCLLSNTNPFMMQWANRDFDGQGHSIGYFFRFSTSCFAASSRSPAKPFSSTTAPATSKSLPPWACTPSVPITTKTGLPPSTPSSQRAESPSFSKFSL